VFCLDQKASACESVADGIRASGGDAVAITHDVTQEECWANVAAEVHRGGRFDAAVHSAGISLVGEIVEMSLADWRKLMAVNLDGVFLGTQAALRLMRAFATPGSIINVSSASGLRASPSASAYCASKAAVCMFSRVAARECLQAGDPIRVNTVCPGAVKTPIWRTVPFFQKLIEEHGSEEAAFAAFAGPKGRFGEPGEIAQAILYLASDEARLVTGTDLVIDDGYVAGV
jgi:NAD(P)-dependent dehydrogenase (short-subunit alcohol dehydrogenase family)